MYEDIRTLVAQLEKNGVGVRVSCDHLSWRVASVDGDEMVRCCSSREIMMFLSGLVFATSLNA